MTTFGSVSRFCVLLSLVISVALTQRTFYENRGFSNYDAGPVQVSSRNFDQHVGPARSADIDTDGIIAPIMQPIASLFDMYTQNKKAIDYADKVEKERRSSLFDPDALLTALKLQTEAPATEPPSFMEKLLEPIIGPVKHELAKVKPSTPKPSFLDGFLANPAAPIVNSDAARRVDPKPILPISSSFLGPEVMSKPLFPSLSLPKEPLPPLIAPKLHAPTLDDGPKPPKTLEDLIPAQLKVKPEPENDLFGLPKIEPIQVNDPFTVNPFMGIFTTAKPIPLPPAFPKIEDKPIHKLSELPIFNQPIFPLQDPFYNPLLPQRKSKLFDFLTGGQAFKGLGR
ncbi:hypothetical protein L596_024129 [Steinernema carpocapsae]|uniref:SXP/RAL-2 family protein Ani s 5-like cation-binding domain-containing protein n=1 Tax=Steinernema carpocapsae TaxID=34508 RepID=A0A4U5MGI2_STECR|nr:hypothetical protein L596_024129 [Steinernema carpocapsae]